MPTVGLIDIGYTPTFLKQLDRLPAAIRRRFFVREQWFRADPFDARLKLHTLTGKLRGVWAFSITYSVRVLLTFDDDQLITFHRIGTHDQAYRFH